MILLFFLQRRTMFFLCRKCNAISSSSDHSNLGLVVVSECFPFKECQDSEVSSSYEFAAGCQFASGPRSSAVVPHVPAVMNRLPIWKALSCNHEENSTTLFGLLVFLKIQKWAVLGNPRCSDALFFKMNTQSPPKV